MEKRRVGHSGLQVSAIGMGCNNFGWTIDAASSKPVLHRALDLGVTLFDTAPIYGQEWGASETLLGEVLGPRRKDVVIVTKFGMVPGGPPDTSRASVLDGIDASLKRLRTDYIDVYMLHWPDSGTPLQETLRALDDVVRAGKARYIGVSNLAAWRVVESKWLSRGDRLHEFIVAQDEYSLAQRKAERDLLPALGAYGMGFMPYSPLANGLLSGKYSRNHPPPADSRLGRNLWNVGDRFLAPPMLAMADALADFARERGRSLLELAVSWLLAQPSVCTVIAGATRTEQVEQNVAAGGWRLTADELAEINRICREAGSGEGAA